MSEHFSPLPQMIKCALPALNARLDIQRGVRAFDGHKREDLDRIAENAAGVLTALGGGLGVLGEMLTLDESARELSSSILQRLGDLIATLGESICALADLQQTAAESEPGIPTR